MAVLDTAISHPRQMRGSSPRMTNYKTVMAGLDPAISSRALEEITGSSPVMTWNWKALRIFLLDNIPIRE